MAAEQENAQGQPPRRTRTVPVPGRTVVPRLEHQPGRKGCRANRLPFLLVVLQFALLGAASGAGFSTSLDRNVVPVGESVTLNLIFDGVSPSATPSLPQLPNLRVAGVNQSSQFSFVNGQQTSQLTYSYTLIPTQPGDITIPGMQVVANGQTLTSHPLALKIVPANAAAANNSPTNLAFVRLIVPKTGVYVGEPFAVEIQLYVQTAKDLRMPQLRAEGFSLSQIPQPSQTRTQVGNAIYQLLVFRLVATAARSGPLVLGPVEQYLKILVPAANPRRSRDPFDSFFGFGGPSYQELPTTLTSESVSMKVLALPLQNVPPTFNGAIGTYQLGVTAGPTNLGVGDPITVRVQITGRGALDAVTLPPQPEWRDFTSYPPTAKLQTTDDLGLEGTKTFEQVLAPQNHEIKLLPPVQFSFFDPTTKGYRTLTGPAIQLSVRAGPTTAAPPSLTNAAPGMPPAADDIVHIKPRLEFGATAAPLLLARPWFLALQGLPAFLWVSLLLWRKRREALANNPRLRRQREVAQRVRDGLKELRACADARKSDEFFAALFRLLQEQLGERLDLPASAITEAVIDQRLRGGRLNDATIQGLHELFQTCNLARYSPVQSSQELAALIPRLETALRELQRLEVS